MGEMVNGEMQMLKIRQESPYQQRTPLYQDKLTIGSIIRTGIVNSAKLRLIKKGIFSKRASLGGDRE